MVGFSSLVFQLIRIFWVSVLVESWARISLATILFVGVCSFFSILASTLLESTPSCSNLEVELLVPEVQIMEPAVAGRASRVRTPCPVFGSNGYSQNQSLTDSASKGWVAASLIESKVWSSPPSPLMDLSMPVPRARFIPVKRDPSVSASSLTCKWLSCDQN